MNSELIKKYRINAGLVLLGGFLGGFVGALAVAKLAFFSMPQSALQAATPSAQTMAVNEESQTTDAVQKAKPSVVSIVAYKEVSLYDQIMPNMMFGDIFTQPIPRSEGSTKEKRMVSGGSGFIISADGLILTNRHVVEDEGAEYHVILNDGTDITAKVLARDTLNDLAFVQIDPKDKKLQPIELGDSDTIKIGETVVAIGNTLSEYSNTVTKGVISGIDRKVSASGALGEQSVLEKAIQTDAAINPGNSGGPLINLAGQVIGINTAVDRGGEGIGFAIPINEAKSVVDDIKKFGRIIRPFLGVRYVLIDDKMAKTKNLAVDHGAYIVADPNDTTPTIVKDSPADKAGLKEGDIITQVDGKDITLDQGLSELLENYKPGATVKLTVSRDGKNIDVNVTLADRSDFNK